jgi:outer membrane biosynthesis protein TonB
MKNLKLALPILSLILMTASVNAADDQWETEEDITSAIQQEITLAEADMEEDEALFADDDEDDGGGDWAEDELEEPTNNAATQEPAPAPAPTKAPAPAPAPAEEVVMDAPAEEETPVEESQPEPAPKKMVRVPASFKQGFKVANSNCPLYSEATENSPKILNTKEGRKLWVEAHNENWYKGYHKGGHGYFEASCF